MQTPSQTPRPLPQLLLGCVLVIIVLMVFLADWRTALISSVAIPLSLLAAGLLLHYRGGTLDTMVLAGLVIALGEVVDDAIIDVENIVRRLRLNREAGRPRPAMAVVFDASIEVRSAVLYGSMIVMLVFLPVFMLQGLAGAFFRPLALAYILAIFASLEVALSVTPALSLLLLRNRDTKDHTTLVRYLRDRYRRMLPAFVDRSRSAMGVLAIMFVFTASVVPFLGEEFLPSFREYDFPMLWVEKPGTSLSAMRRITESVSKELMAVSGVRNFGSHIGRAEVGLVFMTLPFALVGAIVAAFATGGVLSLGSLVGLVTVVGIAARNGIMLVSHYRHLERQEGMAFGRDLVIRGAKERLAPILMTALATGLALVPIVLGGTKAGYEIEHPLAVVILGGLVTSTLLNLFIVPALHLRFGRPATVEEAPTR